MSLSISVLPIQSDNRQPLRGFLVSTHGDGKDPWTMQVHHATTHPLSILFTHEAAAARRHTLCTVLLISSLAAIFWCACPRAIAQELPSASGQQTDDPSAAPTPAQGVLSSRWSRTATKPSGPDRRDSWVDAWLRNTDKARALQPHYTAPIVTTHVILVQQYRYDMSWQQDSPGTSTTANYGASRGLEIVPTTRLEIGISPPNYLVHDSTKQDGIGDLAWQVKFRAFSATEGKGDYFVGFFMGGTLPTGTPANGAGHATLSPTFAAAKGLGNWDVQSTVGASLPLSGTNTLGRSIIFNTAVDYRIRGIVWPMLEQNSTFWSGGSLDGKKETFLTPGLILGSFRVKDRLRVAVGGGFQTAVTPYHQYNHRWILSLRFPF